MKWSSLKDFSFKDLISGSIILTFIVSVAIYLINKDSNVLELIKVLITPVLAIVGVYGGTEGLELVKSKLNSYIPNSTNNAIETTNENAEQDITKYNGV